MTMKRKIRYGLLALAVAAGCMGCAKLHEEIEERYIERPQYDIGDTRTTGMGFDSPTRHPDRKMM